MNRVLKKMTKSNILHYITLHYITLHYINFGAYHKGTARPLLADGEYGLKIWSVAAIIMSNQPRTAYRGGPPACVLGDGQTTFHNQEASLLPNVVIQLRGWILITL